MNIVFLLGVCVVLFTFSILIKKLPLRGKAKLNIFTIYICGILLWPPLWTYLLKENAYKPETIPSLIWPIAILSVEIYLMKYHRLEDQMNSRKGLLSMDANAICSLTFALSSVLSAHRNQCCQNLFIYGVLGCVAFVMPTPHAPSETLESITIETIQRVCLMYSTGLLLAGTMLLNTGKTEVQT